MYKKGNIMYNVLDLSEYIIYYSNIKRYGISCLKLQKILYFLQAEFLRKYNKLCFNSKIEAWAFGPVIPIVYEKYILYGGLDIPQINKKDNFKYICAKEHLKLINDLIDYFKDYAASILTDITIHQEPFIKNYIPYSYNEINPDDIKEYFKD